MQHLVGLELDFFSDANTLPFGKPNMAYPDSYSNLASACVRILTKLNRDFSSKRFAYKKKANHDFISRSHGFNCD